MAGPSAPGHRTNSAGPPRTNKKEQAVIEGGLSGLLGANFRVDVNEQGVVRGERGAAGAEMAPRRRKFASRDRGPRCRDVHEKP
jgi:hypothetical protein